MRDVPLARRQEIADMLRNVGGKVSFASIRAVLARPVADNLEQWIICGEYLYATSMNL